MEFGIWGHILLLIGHIASKREKTRHGSSNDDVINLKAMIERYTFSSGLSLQSMVLFEFLDPKLNFSHASFDHPKGQHDLALYFLQSTIDFTRQLPCKTKIVTSN